MLPLFFLFAFLYLALALAFWSLCRMSGQQQKPWSYSFDEEFALSEPFNEDRASGGAPSPVLTMPAGRTIGV